MKRQKSGIRKQRPETRYQKSKLKGLAGKCTMVLFLMAFLMIALPSLTKAGQCERYFSELVGQCFETVIEGTEFTICFSDSTYGPCPGGIAVLHYTDTQMIDGVEYVAEFEIEFYYTTTPDIVTVAGLDFVLAGGQLILLPDNPLIFDIVLEE